MYADSSSDTNDASDSIGKPLLMESIGESIHLSFNDHQYACV